MRVREKSLKSFASVPVVDQSHGARPILEAAATPVGVEVGRENLRGLGVMCLDQILARVQSQLEPRSSFFMFASVRRNGG